MSMRPLQDLNHCSDSVEIGEYPKMFFSFLKIPKKETVPWICSITIFDNQLCSRIFLRITMKPGENCIKIRSVVPEKIYFKY